MAEHLARQVMLNYARVAELLDDKVERPPLAYNPILDRQCLIKCEDAKQLYDDGDILCVTVEHKVLTDVSVVAPHVVWIDNVHNHFMSFTAFQKSTVFAGEGGEVLPHMDGVTVTNVFPLWLGEQQWPIVKRYLELSVGIFMTGELAGSTPAGVNVIPILIWITNHLAYRTR
jgi:hypothetical protein